MIRNFGDKETASVFASDSSLKSASGIQRRGSRLPCDVSGLGELHFSSAREPSDSGFAIVADLP